MAIVFLAKSMSFHSILRASIGPAAVAISTKQKTLHLKAECSVEHFHVLSLREIVFGCLIFELRYPDVFHVKVFLYEACVGFADAVFVAVRFRA